MLRKKMTQYSIKLKILNQKKLKMNKLMTLIKKIMGKIG